MPAREPTPAPVVLPAVGEEEAAGSATDHDDAGSDFGVNARTTTRADTQLDMYADFAQFAGSPSAQSILNTPSKRSLGRLSVSPIAFKTLRSPPASGGGLPSEAGPSGAHLPVSEPPESPSGISQPPESPTARLQAEDQERERKLVEERELARKAATEREANNRARIEALRLLEGSGDESEEEEIRLSQVMKWVDSRLCHPLLLT